MFPLSPALVDVSLRPGAEVAQNLVQSLNGVVLIVLEQLGPIRLVFGGLAALAVHWAAVVAVGALVGLRVGTAVFDVGIEETADWAGVGGQHVAHDSIHMSVPPRGLFTNQKIDTPIGSI